MALAALAAFCLQARAQEPARPDATYTFAEKDSAVLCLDWYAPKGETTLDGKQKPAIIWVFGGGFTEGTRDEKRYQVWFSQLLDEGTATCKVLSSRDKWYGVTYQADKPDIIAALAAKTEEVLYPSPLWQ